MRSRSGPALALLVCLQGVAAHAQVIEYYRSPEEAIAAGIGRDLKSALLNFRAAAVAKQQLEGKIASARSEFLAGCAAGVRDRQAEAGFVSALQMKDFYYLPFYASGGARQTLTMDRATGGALDGGIAPSAEFSYQVWANAIAGMLRGAASDNSDALSSAAEQTNSLYVRYVSFRNEAEIEHWREHRKISGGPAVSSPDGLADRYVRVALAPGIAAQYGTQPDRLGAMQTWSEQVRAAIIEYEKIEPTVEATAGSLHDSGYPADLIEAFIDRVNRASQNGHTNQVELERAYVAAIQTNDKRRNPRQSRPWEPNMAVVRLSLKDKAGRQISNRMEELIRANPYPLPHQPYAFVRGDIVNGTWYLDAPPASPDADWCTGKPKSSAPSPSSERAAPTNGVAQQAAAATAAAAAKAEQERREAEQRTRDDAARRATQVEAARVAAEAESSASRQVIASALAGVAYGPDIIGLRLGMPVPQAEAVVREHMPVGTVLEAASASGGGTGSRGLGRVRVFISQDRNEQVSLLVREAGPVVGIRRQVAMDDAMSDSDFARALQAKYGPSPSTSQRTWTWGVHAWPCGILRNAILTDLSVLEGVAPATGPRSLLRWTAFGLGVDTAGPGSLPSDPAVLSKCGPLLEIGRNGERLEQNLYDVRIFATEQAAKQLEQARTTTPPKL